MYIGKVRYNVRQNWSEKRRRNINANPIITDGIHKAIIDKKLWDKVQAILESKKGKPSRIYDGEYPLTGILRCTKCREGNARHRHIFEQPNRRMPNALTVVWEDGS